jgi:MSHA biogenesis protein MshI
MPLFGSRRRRPGWLCINLLPERVDVSHVLAAGRARPEVLLCESYRKEGDDVETLQRLKRELQLDRYRCTTLLESGKYQMLQVDAPNVPAQEAKGAVRWRVKDLLDYPVEAATIDALFIPANGAAGRPAQMFVVAARSEIVAATVRPFNEADVALEVIDIPELAQRNLARLLEEEGRGLALLAFGLNGGLLTFTSGGELYQYRRLDIALESFAKTGPEQRRGLCERVVLELQRSLDHFDRQFHHVAVAKVVLAPVPGADDLQTYLAANLDVPVETLDLSKVMDFPHIPELREPERQAQCLQLLGAAMREEPA